MAEIKMRAKFPGWCKECKEAIDKGEDVIYMPDIKKVKHPSCGTPAPKPPKGGSGVTPPKKPASTKQNTLAKIKKQMEPQDKVGEAAAAPKFTRFTVTEIMKLLPAFRALDAEAKKAGVDLSNLNNDKLAEMFRVAKNANFSENEEEYPF